MNPRKCCHHMTFAEKFCVCRVCGQTWVLKKYNWVPVDPDNVYCPGRKPYNRYRKKRRR